MQTSTDQIDFISEDFLKEIHVFETFLNRMGFKRIDGAIYGLLLLSERPLTSEEIGNVLNLSQSAVSQSLKTLSLYGAIQTSDSPENKRIKLHSAKEDSLSIVSTIFRKREGQYIEEFKLSVLRLARIAKGQGPDLRIKKLNSIILTCQTAEAVMNFVMSLTRLQMPEYYEQVLKKLPITLNSLAKSAESIYEFGSFRDDIGNRFEKIKQHWINK